MKKHPENADSGSSPAPSFPGAEMPGFSFLLIAIFWTVTIAVLATLAAFHDYRAALANAETAARHSYGKDLTYRRWSASHGGVYVPVTPVTQPNPYLAHIPERDITTVSGRTLTLVNPAYMTRQVHEISDEAFGTRGHITSLNPIRPENMPDDWERKALEAFAAGSPEETSLETIGSRTFLRLMRPMKVEKDCLKCHAAQGYKVGDIRGGISISIPWAPYREWLLANIPYQIMGYGGLWALGMLGIGFTRQRLYQGIARRRQAEEEKGKLTEQLRQSRKMEAVGRLAGGVAHDFNNMLAVIIGSAEMAKMKLDPADPLYDEIEAIHGAGKRSADLVRQLLAFARKQTIAPRVLDLNATINQMLKMLKRLIGEGIDLLWRPADSLWPVCMDPAQIDQILANLVVNARDAIAGNGRIIIETGQLTIEEGNHTANIDALPGDYVFIAVSDEGCGMDRETMERLFEPFFTTKPQGSGTGLGLATVHGIVKQNHGFINVYSEPGQGTTIRIYLPRHQGGEAAAAPPEERAGNLIGTETVLLVEDDEPLLTFGKKVLQEMGYTVLAAPLPSLALKIAGEFPGEIHLLVTDVIMPEMSGRELAGKLSASRPQMKFLFISGYTADIIARQGVLEPGVHFLQKPFSSEALAAKLRDAIAG